MPGLCKVLAFVLLWVVIPIIAKLIASMLTSFLDDLFAMGLLNRLLGGFIGVTKYALVLGAFIWLFSSMNLIKEETMEESKLCKPLKALPEFIYNHVLKNNTSKECQGNMAWEVAKLHT